MLFGGMTGIVLAFLYLPLAIIVVLSFNTVSSLSWPPKGFTLRWWQAAMHSTGARDALIVSVKTAAAATAIALVLGLLAALAIHRFKFFGREALNLMIVLPIALPGIVTGIALNAAFRQAGLEFGFLTLIIAHSTFCIVVIYNNLLARFRRLSPNLEEASADLGAHTFQTFRYVTFPLLRTALLAGGLLAFGLSFDEIVVTTFTCRRRAGDVADLDLQEPQPRRTAAHRHGGRYGGDVAVGHPRVARPTPDQRRRPADRRHPLTLRR